MLLENTIHLGDCLELMKEIPSNSVDLILCDLPYAVTDNKWDSAIPLPPLWDSYNRIAKPQTPVVLTSVQPFTSELVKSNLHAFRYGWVWEKSIAGGFLNAKKRPLRAHEDVLVFCREQCVYNPQGLVNCEKKHVAKATGTNFDRGKAGRKLEPHIQRLTNYPRSVLKVASEGKTIHPTQKPVELFSYLIKTYTNPGDLVLDNCAGSGTTAMACKATGRRFICIEKDPVYWQKAVDRVTSWNG